MSICLHVIIPAVCESTYLSNYQSIDLSVCLQKNLYIILSINFRTVLFKLWDAARYRAAEVWLPGRGLTPKFVFCTIREYGTAFMLTFS